MDSFFEKQSVSDQIKVSKANSPALSTTGLPIAFKTAICITGKQA